MIVIKAVWGLRVWAVRVRDGGQAEWAFIIAGGMVGCFVSQRGVNGKRRTEQRAGGDHRLRPGSGEWWWDVSRGQRRYLAYLLVGVGKLRSGSRSDK